MIIEQKGLAVQLLITAKVLDILQDYHIANKVTQTVTHKDMHVFKL